MVVLPNQKDNRFFTRLSFRSGMRYQLRGKPDFANALCNDISCGGLRFTTDGFLPISAPVMLEFNILNRVLRPTGKVAWSMPLAHSHRSQTGIEFVEFDSIEQIYLKNFIDLKVELV